MLSSVCVHLNSPLPSLILSPWYTTLLVSYHLCSIPHCITSDTPSPLSLSLLPPSLFSPQLRDERIRQLETSSRSLTSNMRNQAERHVSELTCLREQIQVRDGASVRAVCAIRRSGVCVRWSCYSLCVHSLPTPHYIVSPTLSPTHAHPPLSFPPLHTHSHTHTPLHTPTHPTYLDPSYRAPRET
jgi:hypothetical protein